jgi:uridine kinase
MFFVGIAGGSGSGKTTFAKKILKGVPATEVAILHQDSYYLPAPPESNFDHPDAFDWELFHDHLEKLKQGLSVEVPTYDFKKCLRTGLTSTVGPCRAIVVEGIYTLWKPEVRSLFDIRIFLNVDADIRFIRRLHRDVRERARSLDSIIRQYYDTVRPMHHEFLEPTRQYADIVVGEETDIAAEVVAARIQAQFKKGQSKAQG